MAFDDKSPVPQTLSKVPQIAEITQAFADAAKRAESAGFDVVEIHSAHGYLLHEFLSPLSNLREDAYGGSFENRTRAVRETVEAIRKVWPDRSPLFIRISATDWAEGGWNIDESVALAKMVKPMGIDLVDCSSGALGSRRYHSRRSWISGSIFSTDSRRCWHRHGRGRDDYRTKAGQFHHSGWAGRYYFMAREFLRDPYWPLHAAKELGEHKAVKWPVQYERAMN